MSDDLDAIEEESLETMWEDMWNHCCEWYPIGSAWRYKKTGEVYTVRELRDAGLWVMVIMERGRNWLYVANASFHLEFARA